MSDYQSRDTTSGMGTGESYNANTGMEAVGGSLNAGTGTSGSSTADGGMMQRVTETANQARDFITDKVSGMGDSMRDVTESMRGGMGNIREMDRDDFAMMYDDMLESCRRNPGRTILISAAVGMALGMMMRGNERRW